MRAPVLATTALLLLVASPSRSATAAPPVVPADRYRAATERLTGAALASDHAWLRLSQLCDGIGHRVTGSPQLDRAIAWAAAAMREDGLDRVRTLPVEVPRWRRGFEHAEMVEPGPQRLDILGLGRSPATPAGGITAEVVAVRSFAEFDSLPESAVRGRIVLYDVPFTTYGATVRYRSDGAKRAARRGAVAVLVRSVGPVSLRTPHTGAMSDSLPNVPAAAVTIEDAGMITRLLARGQRVRVHLELDDGALPDTLSADVIGELRGRERPDEVVVVGGHIDSWDVGQGAQDDGGGCVISMEALRLIKQLGLRPRRTLRCVLFTNEESGAKGGQAYADSLGKKQRHVAAIESDGGVEKVAGFGFTQRRADQPDSADAPRSRELVARMQPFAPLLAGIGADRFDPEGGGTDIGPLMKLGVPGLSHKTTMEHYFDWHHTRADMMDKVDPLELRKNVAAMAVMLYLLAELPEPGGAAAPVPTRR